MSAIANFEEDAAAMLDSLYELFQERGIGLFFAWRSLFSYFFYVDLIALAYIMVNDHIKQRPTATNVLRAAGSV